jgi:hypothetical protein
MLLGPTNWLASCLDMSHNSSDAQKSSKPTIHHPACISCTFPFKSVFPVDCRLLCLGRFLVGLGIGISAVVVPVYLGEVAPAQVNWQACYALAASPTHQQHGICSLHGA